MTKKGFLEKLKKRLSILTEEEREDILNEYKVIIDDKIKHGQTEAEAIADFGDFDEFVDEILSAYKIDPKATKKENESTKTKAKTFLESGEELIKDGAQKLTEATDRLVNDFKENNTEITVELIFELVLKGIVALIIMAILTLPFRLIYSLGSSILDFAFFPVGSLLTVLWKLMVSVLYFGACIFLVIALFKEYVKNPSGLKKNKTVKKDTKTNPSKKKDEKVNISEKKEDKQDTERIVRENRREHRTMDSHTLSNLFLILLKIFMIFVFIIPLWICIISLFVIIAILFFLLFKGISVIGFILGAIGVVILLMQLSNLLYNGIFNNSKIHAYPFLISVVLIIVGSFMAVDFVANIEYIDQAPATTLEKKEYQYTIDKTFIVDTHNAKKEFILDNTMENNQVQIQVFYYDDFVSLEKEEYNGADNFIVSFHTFDNFSLKKQYNFVLDNLKKNRIYNHDKLSKMHVKVYCNEATQNAIILDR